MDDRGASSETSRRWVTIAAAGACVVVGLLVWAFAANGSSTSGPDEAEVCDTTEYEGCISRWDYLLTDDD